MSEPSDSNFPPDNESPDDDTLIIERGRLERERARYLERRASATHELKPRELSRLMLHTHNPALSRRDLPQTFVTLPVSASAAGPRWLIELHLDFGSSPLGVEVAGDVVLGVTRPSSPAPDLDLEAYGAYEKGVSRRHAMLRPSHDILYLIDLDSTNGTQVNMMPVRSGTAVELHTGDIISLGTLNFTLSVLLTPGDQRASTGT